MQFKISKIDFKNPKVRMIAVSSALILVIAVIITIVAVSMAAKEKVPNGTDDVGAFKEGTDKPLQTGLNQTTAGGTGTSTDGTVAAEGLTYVSNGDGTCTVSDIGTSDKSELAIPAKSPDGDNVTALADGAFADVGHLVSVNIPATVKTIGSRVFAGCSNLVSITVSSSNTSYVSVGGVLFTKDRTVIVCYPAARGTSSYFIEEYVKKIDAYAFDGVKGLSRINYPGSAQNYDKIEVGVGNSMLANLTLVCNYKGK